MVALKLIKKEAALYQKDLEKVPRDKGVINDHLGELTDLYKNIESFGEVGQGLSKSNWQDEELRKILFEYLFSNYLERSPVSFESLLDKNSLPELWELINKANNKRNSIKNP